MTDVTSQLDILIRYKFLNASTISNAAKNDLDNFKKRIENYIEEIVKCNDSFLDDADVSTFISRIWDIHVSEEYKPSRLMSIYRDGSIRYSYKIPPGYMDDPKNNKDSSKSGVDIFGDLVLWNQILDCGYIEKRPIVFVTADVKEDWFHLTNDYPNSPREELLDEFNEKTGGIDICIITSDIFVKYLSNIKAINASEALLEMQMDDFVDITIRNKRENISKKLIAWGNDSDHILQFPFRKEVNNLLNIDNARYVVKSSYLQLKEKIEYSAVIEGTADFLGVNHDEVMKCNTSEGIQATFKFSLRISFFCTYHKDSAGNCIPSEEIEDMQITNATFEEVLTTDTSLESRRGVFILPTKKDKEIYEYMESIWDEYENGNSINKAEAMVYFDAAKHFKLSLLEINRSYTLVQNSKSKSMLSLNEIDALALNRFSDIRIEIKDGVATYNENIVPVGNAYPIPESMKLLPPEKGQEIDVTFEVKIKHTDDQFIVCTGTTSLPPKTDLMLTLHSPELKYHAQSKVVVNADRKFVSQEFSNSHNPPQNKMLSGNYVLEIVMPIVSVQPEEVKMVLGKKGRNLSGAHVDEDVIWGKTVRYEKNFLI